MRFEIKNRWSGDVQVTAEIDCDEGVVECNFHNGAFNIMTGEVVAPPCMVPLRTYKVSVVDGQVCIDPNASAL